MRGATVMMKHLLAAAMAAFAVFIIAMAAILGGCGGTREKAPDFFPGSLVEEDNRERESIPFRIGRLETRVKATVTVYRAGTGAAGEEEVTLLPGTWLLPASVFENTEDADAER